MTGAQMRMMWVGLIALTLAMLAMSDWAKWLIDYPQEWVLPITPWLNAFMDWTVAVFGPAFKAFSAVMDIPMSAVREFLNWLPWSVTLVLLTFAAYGVSGIRLAIFTFLAVLYMVVIGYWPESMNSLSLVAISVPMAVAIGFSLGALAFFSDRAERILKPTMDLLQTVPAFAYLLPILLLFGFGPVVGLIASILYAFPPTVRNTMLGLRRVPSEVIEAGLMSGATGPQLFWRVRVPSAMRQILLGVNQTTMAAFSMVIIASIIGGTADIGWEVLSTMRKAQFGESLLAGIVIALMAMVMDRITAAAATAEPSEPQLNETFWSKYQMWLLAAGLALLTAALAQVFPALSEYPREWEIFPAQYLNDAVTFVVVEYADAINTIKTVAFFFVMLPVK
ncbi:MAG: ABC transporter permease subunit, partial [Pseudomonadota bacterium]